MLVIIIGTVINIGSMTGLNCSSIEVFKCLEEIKSLENLKVAQWGGKIGNSNTIVDFRDTGLKDIRTSRSYSKYLFTKYCVLCCS